MLEPALGWSNAFRATTWEKPSDVQFKDTKSLFRAPASGVSIAQYLDHAFRFRSRGHDECQWQ